MKEEGGLRLLHLSWEDVQKLTEEVAEKVRRSGFTPDVIVAVSRGGFDPARILCDQLGIMRLASVQIEYYTGVSQTGRAPRVIYPLNAEVPGLRVLVVDDVSDTGTSLKVAMDHVAMLGASEVRVATLHVKPWTTFRPDYSATEVDAWIVYPWEPMESMASIAERLSQEGLTRPEIKRRLIEMGFKGKIVDKLR
ncbi:MAG: phosphoribosyltransferase [Candidatus Bathyarchaeota archaeon]|nr:phosphoribosyltransferase [Candidatus Bathyarchaeota archaeon]